MSQVINRAQLISTKFVVIGISKNGTDRYGQVYGRRYDDVHYFVEKRSASLKPTQKEAQRLNNKQFPGHYFIVAMVELFNGNMACKKWKFTVVESAFPSELGNVFYGSALVNGERLVP